MSFSTTAVLFTRWIARLISSHFTPCRLFIFFLSFACEFAAVCCLAGVDVRLFGGSFDLLKKKNAIIRLKLPGVKATTLEPFLREQRLMMAAGDLKGSQRPVSLTSKCACK